MLLIFTDKVSTGNVEMNSTMSGFHPGGDGEAMKTWKAMYFRSGAHSLQVNENRSRFSHVNAVIENAHWKIQ